MSLENLLRTGQLVEHQTDSAEIGLLLRAARRNLADASVAAISPETRFDAAYKAVMQLALSALMAHGFRPDKKHPGHHATVLQSLPKTIGLSSDRLVVLDALRKKRNLSDYTVEFVDDGAVDACRQEAARLLDDVSQWLSTNRPDLGA